MYTLWFLKKTCNAGLRNNLLPHKTVANLRTFRLEHHGVTDQRSDKLKQGERGHNIVADGWAGASNPHLDPTHPPTTLKHLKRPLSYFLTRAHGRTDGRTDRRTKPLIELRVRVLVRN